MNYQSLSEQTRLWAEQAYAAGWLTQDIATELMQLETLPEPLIGSTDNADRPLLVAFMGGTGVGKSSLLNRLAGKAIARAGIERPTSREVTVFHHRSLTVKQLPELSNWVYHTAQHEDVLKKNIVWIDMPDFDSTETHNKQQVLQWLPHIDVLLYVVSPERYRDEKAWRLLIAEGAKHAWIFILNQWDKGQNVQYEDFKQQLYKAGFNTPLIFKTSCADAVAEDQFESLEHSLIQLATAHTIAQLSQRSMQARKNSLQQKLQYCCKQLGTIQAMQQTMQHWQAHWQQGCVLLQQGLSLPITQLAAHYADTGSRLSTDFSLWDSWARARFNDILQDFIANATAHGLPNTVLQQAFAPLADNAAKQVQSQSELALRMALAKPGNNLQRGLLTLTRYSEIVLPLAAMTWVSYRVFESYQHNDYLGINFALHSSLLIALTWLIPYFIIKKARPSLKKTALKGLNKGLVQALHLINNEVLAILHTISQEHNRQQQQLTTLSAYCDAETQWLIDANSPLKRLLTE